MAQLEKVVRKLKARGIIVRWTPPPVATALDTVPSPEPQVDVDGGVVELPSSALLGVVERTVVLRAAIANKKGEQALRKMGVKVVRATRSTRARRSPDTQDAVA
jgi:hypothetical protein